MDITKNIKVLRIYSSNTDKFRRKPLYEVIVFAAKRLGMSGATVFRGIMGYGKNSLIKSVKFWEVSEKLPITVEIIDEAEKIYEFLDVIKPYFEKVEKGILVSLEDVNIIFSKPCKSSTEE